MKACGFLQILFYRTLQWIGVGLKYWAPITDSLFGGLPELEFDGERLGQSMSIARFLASEFGLTGRTNVERARCDGIVDAGIDMANAGFKFRSV